MPDRSSVTLPLSFTSGDIAFDVDVAIRCYAKVSANSFM